MIYLLTDPLGGSSLFPSIDVKFIFNSVRLSLSSSANMSRCRPPSSLLAVFAMFLAIISPISSCSSNS